MQNFLSLAPGCPLPHPAIRLPVFLLQPTGQSVILQSIERNFPSAVEYIPYVPARLSAIASAIVVIIL